MAKFFNANILLGIPIGVRRTIDLGTATRTWTLGLEVEPLDPTAITDAGERVLGGQRKDTVTWAGLFDDGTSLDGFIGTAGTGTILINVFLGSAIGSTVYGMRVIPTGIKPSTKVGELVAQAADFRVDGTIERGVTFAFKTAFASGTTITSTLDNGTESTNGGAVYFFVHSGDATAAVATDNFYVDQSTSGTGGWSATFFDSVTPGTSEGQVYTGTATIQRYLRMRKTGSGSLTASLSFIRR